MKTKCIQVILGMLCMVYLSSCGALLAPQYAETEKVLCYVYDVVREESTSELEDGLQLLAILAGGKLATPTTEEKIQNTKMLEWSVNEQMLGDSYTGYFVTYRVVINKGENSYTYYALVDLTEFDSGEYEWEVVDVDESLSAIQSWLY